MGRDAAGAQDTGCYGILVPPQLTRYLVPSKHLPPTHRNVVTRQCAAVRSARCAVRCAVRCGAQCGAVRCAVRCAVCSARQCTAMILSNHVSCVYYVTGMTAMAAMDSEWVIGDTVVNTLTTIGRCV